MPAPRPKVQITFQPTDPLATDHDLNEPVGHEVTTRIAPGARWLLQALLLAALAIASASPAVNGQFLPHDDSHVSQNMALRSWQGLRAIWLSPQRMESPYPVTFTALLIEYRMFRDQPTGYHVVSLCLHACVTVLLWTLLTKIGVPGAIFAAALFAVHPVQVATVAWIAQQKALWCAMFFLASLIVYFRFCGINPAPEFVDGFDAPTFRLARSRSVLYPLSMSLWLLALASQAVAVTFVPIVLTVIWWKRARISRDDLKPLVFPAMVSLLAAIMFATIEWRHGARGESFPQLLQRVQLIGLTFWADLRNLLAPIGLSYVYPRFALRAGALWQYLPTIAVFGLFIALWRLRARIGRGAFAAAALFGVLVLPYAGLVNFKWMEQSFVGDQMLYLPCAVPGIALASAVASAFARLMRSPPRVPAFAPPLVGCAIVIALMSVSIVRAREYRDPKLLWTAALARNPRVLAARNALGVIAMEAGNRSEAFRHFAQALELDDDDIRTHLNLAELYESSGQADLAMGEYHRVLRANPDDPDAHLGVARGLARQNDSRGAIREYQQALAIRPDDSRAHWDLGQLRESRDEMDDAIRCYREAIRLNPRFVQARNNLALALFRTGAVEESMEQLKTIVERIDPKYFEGWMNAAAITGTVAAAIQDPAQKRHLYGLAQEYYRGAIQLNRNSAEAYCQRGIVLMKLSLLESKGPALAHIKEAIDLFKRAVELKPDYVEAAQFAQSADVERQRRENDRDDR